MFNLIAFIRKPKPQAETAKPAPPPAETTINSESPPVPPKEASNDRATILVMGPTGVGKSTFINVASNSDLRVSDSLLSCTDKIEISRPFILDGKEVVLVDTPGFDDTAKSDSDILNIVCDYLSSEYGQGHLLHGIIYLYRITDNRVSGTASRNLRFYRELCGPETLQNSVLVTNMWSQVDPAKGEAREAELKTKPNFFKPALDAGAQLARHDGTAASAHAIVRRLLARTPAPLRIQRELVDDGLRVFQTIAGEALLEDLARAQQKHLEEMQQLEADMADALRERDEEAQRELEEERRRVQAEQEKLEQEKQKLLQLKMAVQKRTMMPDPEPEDNTTAAASTTVLPGDMSKRQESEPEGPPQSCFAGIWSLITGGKSRRISKSRAEAKSSSR